MGWWLVMEQTMLIVKDERPGLRLDTYLTGKMADLSRSRIQKLIKEGSIQVNGKCCKSNYVITDGDEISVSVPPAGELELIAQDISLKILYEDSDIIVVDKPQGMVVHPAAGNYEGTLVNALLYHCKDLSGINGTVRPGIVHRIDKDTSGVLVVAKNDVAHMHLAEQIKEHTITRIYNALVHGTVKEPAGIIEAPIGRHPVHRKKMAVVLNKNAKVAITHYRVLERFNKYTYIEARLETGRTHQIRVHMSYTGHPVVGDPVYGPRKGNFNLKGQALHARILGFIHPKTGEHLEFEAPLPAYYTEILEILRKEH
jgi:23S rRNA pseudouridine1911/1915/1917 synthase